MYWLCDNFYKNVNNYNYIALKVFYVIIRIYTTVDIYLFF